MMCLLQLKQSIPVSIAIISLLQWKDCWDSNIAIESLLFMVPSIFLAVAIFLPEKENRVWHFKYISLVDPTIDPMCSLCELDKETFYHFLAECPRLQGTKASLDLDPGDHNTWKQERLLELARVPAAEALLNRC